MKALPKQKVIHIPACGIPPVEPGPKRLPLRIPMTPNNSDRHAAEGADWQCVIYKLRTIWKIHQAARKCSLEAFT
jgi:hypothetical protein